MFTVEDVPDDGPTCPVCGGDLQWEDCCEIGCEDGFHDGYEKDPLWYDEGDFVRCETCHGKGGWWVCPNYANHPAISAEVK